MTERLREELDYEREARHATLYGHTLADEPLVRVPTMAGDLSTRRLLTMQWLDGQPLLTHLDNSLEDRNRIATAMFRAWWYPFARFGIIHGDPHLGNYTVFDEEPKPRGKRTAAPAGINLLDFGCIRIFPTSFVQGVVDLYEGLRHDDRDRIVQAYRGWGFKKLTNEIVDALNIWARFIYAPLLDDRVRTIADGVAPQAYGRREVWQVKQRLRPLGSITIPREFVLMDRAAIGLGSVMLHLRAELNFHRLFAATVGEFNEAALAKRQAAALQAAGL
jgi:predicted unusual protein kinase regulating ubiquinone biosynthesis (AarF/ABC1/UbiB family)